MLEQKDQLLNVVRSQLLIHVVQRMGNRMLDSGEHQIFLKLVDVSSELLDLGVLRLSKVPDDQVNLNVVVVGKEGCHLFADESIRQLCDLKASVDPVVIGECNVGHPLFFQPPVKQSWIGIAIGELEAAENPFSGSIAEFRMDMEVDFCGHRVSWESVQGSRFVHSIAPALKRRQNVASPFPMEPYISVFLSCYLLENFTRPSTYPGGRLKLSTNFS